MARRRQAVDERAAVLANVPDLVVLIGRNWGWDAIVDRRRMVDDLAAQGVVLSWDELRFEGDRRRAERAVACG